MTTETTPERIAAGYRIGTGFRRCWNCRHFALPADAPAAAGDDASRPTCPVVAGAVEPTAVCDRWEVMADRARKRTGFRSAQRQHGGKFLWDDESGTGGGGPVGL